MRQIRMYLPRSNAQRDSNRTKTGTWSRCASMSPSGRHGRAVSEAAVGGTRAWTALGHREVRISVPTGPLSAVAKTDEHKD